MQPMMSKWKFWRPGYAYPQLPASEPPLRAELFSVDQLTRHAKALADSHRIVTGGGSSRLLTRLGRNEEILRTFNRMTLAVNLDQRITPAAEWLFDNFGLIEEQVQLARRHLPRGYSRELPCLGDGHSSRLPRVYDIVLELISHVDAQIEAGPLSAFIEAYQTTVSLKLGELWAIPIMLRLGLIDNLQRITSRLLMAGRDRELARQWVERLQVMAEANISLLVVVVAEMAKADLPLSSAFVTEFCQHLSRHSPVLHLARTFLEQRLVEQGLTIEQMIQQESQNQAADQVSVSHSIASLRFLSAMDWEEFVETMSRVEETLLSDPADVYRLMDFASRDRCRHAVELLARNSRFSEVEVARLAIRQAAESVQLKGRSERSSHVGFYLVDKGRTRLGAAVNVRWPLRTMIELGIRRYPLTFYIGGIAGFTALATAGFVWQALRSAEPAGMLLFFTLLFSLCVSQLAVSLINGLSALLVKPVRLPRLDTSSGIAPGDRTLVVIPTMLSSAESIDRLIETLEIHYLANRDPSLHFAVLTDFRDAPSENLPEDQDLLQRVREGILRLTGKYSAERSDLFFLFHRPRRWNAAEGVWMGYERKRGKLMELNARLRGGGGECFTEVIGETSILPLIRYVITLDTDTQLPRDSARHLVGTLAHPLNRPRFDKVRRIVTEGYSILQPRVEVSLPSARRSWFVRIFAGETGIDPYTREVSDVYQDIFHEGSFIGKGIYDVDAFQQAMEGCFPENTILSHDLLEACYARSALVTDVMFYEDYPSRYNADADRRHRWIRGDWQLMQWLLSKVPGADKKSTANPLSVLSQWKIFDNLRRSLIPVAQMLLLLGTWLFVPRFAGAGCLLVLALIALPGLVSLCGTALRRSAGLPLRMHLRKVVVSCGQHSGQILLALLFLPYHAFLSLDAIGRTLLRLVTRRRLLEWQNSSDSERAKTISLAGFFTAMWSAPAVAVTAGFYLAVQQPGQLLMTLPLLALWIAAPWVAWWISQPIHPQIPDLTAKQTVFLRHAARRTWHYFESFVTAQDNWLPPDNFQEVPTARIASRTSPTNMGLSLLANLAAYDFGYLSAGALIRRTQETFTAMQSLERHRGHFYNWYDTQTRQPLLPLYVSSVDSGNLSGHLLTLSSGLREQGSAENAVAKLFAGLRDTAGVLSELVHENAGLVNLCAELDSHPSGLTAAFALLKRVDDQAALLAVGQHSNEEVNRWLLTLRHNCHSYREEMLFLAPWLLLSRPRCHRGGAGLQRHLPPAAGDSGSRSMTFEDQFDALLLRLDESPALCRIANHVAELQALIRAALQAVEGAGGQARREEQRYLTALSGSLDEAGSHACQRLQTLEALARHSEELATADFTFLFDKGRNLFVTGFNQSEYRNDTGFYDLLASEARMCSYVAIALGQVPQDHWFAMGRLLIALQGTPTLVSWSGSMFEYLMPLLVMPRYESTLLDHTCKAAVQQQIAYGRVSGVPWGISESGYNRKDAQMNYQYRAFGVPGLGLKRGLSEDLVIAPYATVMALMIAPRKACENLQRMSAEGRSGTYGFYEAVDYTPARLPPGESSVTIRSFMGHHQAMSLLALDNLLQGNPMPRRFMACPLLKAAELLLQERVPTSAVSVFTEGSDGAAVRPLAGANVMRVFTNPASQAPEVHLLSNGRYHVAISSAGGGYSRWHDLAVTRWREDATRDCWGTFVYLRDPESGEFWSTAHQPVQRETKGYEAIFTQARAEFRHHYIGVDVHTEICVSPEDDVELRRIKISNRTPDERIIELTSYAEVVLATQAADEAHPAFSSLFVQTEFVPSSAAIICTRRPRSVEERPPWLLHLMPVQEGERGELSCETDRARFVGRGGSLASPAAMRSAGALSNTVGSVLDPVISLRRTVVVPPHDSATVDLIVGVAESREAALALADKYQSRRMADRAFDLAWTHSQVTLHQLNATEAEAQLYGRLAGALIYADPARRANPQVLCRNRRGQSSLWAYGISGDVPIVLLRISNIDKIEIVAQAIKAHSYWRMKGLIVELVIMNENVSVYLQSLHEQIIAMIASGIEAQLLDKPGGIFVRRQEQISNDDRVLLQAAARVVLDDEKGTLAEQLKHRSVLERAMPTLEPVRLASFQKSLPLPLRDLIFRNGYGGFTPDGHEYVITLQPGQLTPMPWVNVLANPSFGTVVSESGAAYTWLENAHAFRLTPWNNDSVQDPAGEAFYIRDDQSGEYWSPTPLPACGATATVIRHGFGYTVYEHTENGIVSELWVYVAMDAPVKFMVLKVRNRSGRSRCISVTGYWEWVLGDVRRKNLLHIQTEVDLKTGALLARNNYNSEFAGRIAFLDVNDSARTVTGDRKEFIGRNGSLARPAAMKRTRLSGRVGAVLDPCGAIQVAYTLADGQERETVFRLGVGRSAEDVQSLIRRFRAADTGRTALEGVWAYWNRTLGAVNVDTPDPAVNVMANGWLLYQTLSARLWGRTGFYQSGGAYGFRDQLQDVMALMHAEPALTREHLLRAAAHQFREGDVQHWWHPPEGSGVRTNFSDDYLWLPYATCRYIACVADTGVLNEKIAYIEARLIKPGEEAYYDRPNRSEEEASLYQHCVRAIERGLRFGEHGLPLIGCGDWNDGMNRVGYQGRGESVWLAFFLYDVLSRFAEVAAARDDSPFAARCLKEARQLQQNIERSAWDGQWYRRAFFDSGEPLGSRANAECQIDSISQSWAVLSGAGEPSRSRQAMRSVEERLVRREEGLIKLFDPPFDSSDLEPGYIKGYIPGVRENGGQYTHGAIWTAMAFARLGESEHAWELFNLLNPVHHGDTPEHIATYKVEPYVVAADVYAVAPHTGRGGWTWYTGSASWMYRLLIEDLLGAKLEGGQLRLAPRLPAAWPSFKIHYRYRQTVYHITILRGAPDAPEPNGLTLDGKRLTGTLIPLRDDRQEHFAELMVE